MKLTKLFSALAVTGLLMGACSDNENNSKSSTDSSRTNIQITLTDAPADYDAVLIDLQDVKINYKGDTSAWQELDNIEPGIYNLLELTGGVDTLIASSEIDTGIVAQIRLILGENNFIVVDGDTIGLKTPSAQQSGLKVHFNEQLTGGINYKIGLDFDAAKSIVKAGNSGKYILKPVIRAFLSPVDGQIIGSISDTIDAAIFAIIESDSMGTYPDTSGNFAIKGLEEGNYSLYIEPEAGINDTTLENISVSNGAITNLGYIELSSEE